MPDYPKLFETAAGAIGLQDEIDLLKALADVGTKWRELARELATVEEMEALLDKLSEEIDRPQTEAAFGRLGLEDAYATLKRLVGASKDALDRIPAKYKALLKPMSDFTGAGAAKDAGLLQWRLLGGTKTLDRGKYKLAVEGSSKFVLDAASKPTIAGKKAETPKLRLGIEAKIGGAAEAKIPIKWGSIGGSAESSVRLAFDGYFHGGPDDERLGTAAAKRLAALPDPFDYFAVWDAFADGSGLQDLVYTFATASKANAKVKLSAPGGFGGQVLQSVEAEFSARGSLSQEFQLSLSRVPEGSGFRIHLVRGRQKELGLSVGVSATADLSKPMAAVHEVLEQAIARSDKVIGKLAPYLAPGTLLQTEAKDLLADRAGALFRNEALAKAVAADLERLLGIGSAESSATLDHLQDLISQAIDRNAALLLQSTAQARGEIVEQLARRLQLAGLPDAKAELEAALDPLVAKGAAKLNTGIRNFLAEPSKDVAAALKKVGVKSSRAVATLDAQAKPIRDLIDRYTKLLEKAQKVAADAAKAKVSVRFELDALWEWSQRDLLVGTFNARTTDARELFEKISTGDLAAIRQAIRPPTPIDGFAPGKESRYEDRTAYTQKEKFALVVFGTEISAETILKADATIAVDGKGDLHVGATGELRKRFSFRNESKEVAFFSTYAMTVAENDPALQGTRSIEMGAQATNSDDAFRLRELQAFTGGFEKAKLLPSTVSERATAQFREWTSGLERPRIAGDVAVKLWLTVEEAKAAIRLDGREKDGSLKERTEIEIIKVAIEAAESVGQELESQLIEARHAHEDIVMSDAGNRNLTFEAALHAEVKEKKKGSRRGMSARRQNFELFVRRMRALLSMIEAAGVVYLATANRPEFEVAGGWDEEKYRRAMTRIAEGSRTWLNVFFGFDEPSSITLAFFATLARLARVEGTPPLSLVLTRREGTGGGAGEDPAQERVKESVTFA